MGWNFFHFGCWVVANAASCPQTLDMDFARQDPWKDIAEPALQTFTKVSDRLYRGDDGKHFWSRCRRRMWKLSDKEDCSGESKLIFWSNFGNCWDDRGSLYVIQRSDGSVQRTRVRPVSGLQPYQRPRGRNPTTTTPFPVATETVVQKNKTTRRLFIIGIIGIGLLLLTLLGIMYFPCNQRK